MIHSFYLDFPHLCFVAFLCLTFYTEELPSISPSKINYTTNKDHTLFHRLFLSSQREDVQEAELKLPRSTAR